MGNPAAVLWDMDGTLVDTEPYWIDVEFELAEKYGGTWSHEHALQPGRQRPDRLRRATSASTWASTVEPAQIVEELLDGVVARVERQVPWRPGAVELLAELRAPRRAVRAGHDVLPRGSWRRSSPRCRRAPSTSW